MLRKMTSQTKISTFFKSPNSALKRNTSNTHKNAENLNKSLDDQAQPEPKKLKSEKENDDKSVACNTTLPLSPDEKKKIQDNRVLAKLKLLSSQNHGVVTDVGVSWFPLLEEQFHKDYFKELCTFVSSERKKGKVYPPADQVFTWTKACDLKDVKVVILGQDPYHGPSQAHGLCFSVLPGVRPPPSLVNMFKELDSDVEEFRKPDHGNLIGWATQGVLLLNACLTVRAGQPNSHAGKGWEKLTDAVIHWLNSNTKGIVFMLWGSYAQKKGSFIDKKRHHILKAVHPSPLSAHRGFFGCKHFSLCNQLLKDGGNQIIDWNYLPEHLD